LETKDHFNSAGGNNPAARLERLYARLSAVPDGAEVVEMLKRNNVAVTFDPDKEYGANTTINFGHTNGRDINYSSFEIVTCGQSGDDWLIQAIVHESQHVRHHVNRLGNPEFERTLEQECILRRIQEADAQTKATEICWLLKQAGDAGPWEAAENSIYAGMCAAYEAEMNRSGDRAASRRAAFDAWFLDDRLYFYDYNTLINNYFCKDGAVVQNDSATAYMFKEGLKPAESAAALASALEKIGGLSAGAGNYLARPGTAAIDGPPYSRLLAENLAEGRARLQAESAAKAGRRFDSGNGNLKLAPAA
jgi:hypothetical protein